MAFVFSYSCFHFPVSCIRLAILKRSPKPYQYDLSTNRVELINVAIQMIGIQLLNSSMLFKTKIRGLPQLCTWLLIGCVLASKVTANATAACPPDTSQPSLGR